MHILLILSKITEYKIKGKKTLKIIKKGGKKMSRIGNKPITVPAGVEVKVDGNHVTVKGPKGTLEREIHKNISIEMDGNVINFKRIDDEPSNRGCGRRSSGHDGCCQRCAGRLPRDRGRAQRNGGTEDLHYG